MRLLLTALNCPKGDVAGNLARHRDLLADGRRAGCDLVLLPEMSLTGYRPPAAITLEHPAVAELARATAGGPSLCFGLVERSGTGTDPGAPFITQVLAAEGRLAAVHRKAWLPADEQAHFSLGAAGPLATLGGVSTSVAVCAEIGTEPPHRRGSTLVLGPAAPGLYGERRSDADWQRGFDWWRDSVRGDAARLLRPGTWLAVSTQAGATDDEDFPGWSALLGPEGQLVAELPDWREGQLVVDLPTAALSAAAS